MTEQTHKDRASTQAGSRRRVTLREMRERLAAEAYNREFHHAVMVKLAAEETVFAADPDELQIAEAFDSAARVLDWLLRDDVTLARLKEAAERGEV